MSTPWSLMQNMYMFKWCIYCTCNISNVHHNLKILSALIQISWSSCGPCPTYRYCKLLIRPVRENIILRSPFSQCVSFHICTLFLKWIYLKTKSVARWVIQKKKTNLVKMVKDGAIRSINIKIADTVWLSPYMRDNEI
jgi:hypothetical protein